MQQKADTTLPIYPTIYVSAVFSLLFCFHATVNFNRSFYSLPVLFWIFRILCNCREYCYRNKSNGFILDSSNFDFQFKRWIAAKRSPQRTIRYNNIVRGIRDIFPAGASRSRAYLMWHAFTSIAAFPRFYFLYVGLIVSRRGRTCVKYRAAGAHGRL